MSQCVGRVSRLVDARRAASRRVATGVPTPVRAASPRVRRTTEDFEKAQPSVSWAFYLDTVKKLSGQSINFKDKI